MNELTVFNNEEFGKVRTLSIDNEPWFVGKDVAEALGYKDTSDAMRRHVEDEDKLTRCFTDSGQGREMYVINESGLYSLILSSKLASARQFKKWITSDVIPSIRRHGVYAVDKLLNNPDFLIKALTELKEERQKRIEAEEETLKLVETISELQPKADYTDTILRSTDAVTITQIGQDYGMSGKALNATLKSMGIQHKVNDQWILYTKYQGKGYVKSVTFHYERTDGSQGTAIETRWTQRGRLFLYEKLKENGILPLIER